MRLLSILSAGYCTPSPKAHCCAIANNDWQQGRNCPLRQPSDKLTSKNQTHAPRPGQAITAVSSLR